MFGDAMFDEEERLRRSADAGQDGDCGDELDDVFAVGGLDDRLERRQAISQLLREVGGC